jgi:hypothetical protein
VLGGATFFISNAEARISSTTGLLIAVTALYIIILGNIPFVGYATTIDSFVLVMLGMLAGIILIQVVYLLLFNYVYKGEEGVADGDVHPVLRPSSAPERSLPFQYLMNLCFSTSLADDDNTSGRQDALKRKSSTWLLWFSPESSQLLGEVCVAAMIKEHQKTIQQQKIVQQHECNAPTSSNGSGNSSEMFPLRSATPKDSPIFSSVARNLRREKEIKKPVATFAMLGIEYCGRVF